MNVQQTTSIFIRKRVECLLALSGGNSVRRGCGGNIGEAAGYGDERLGVHGGTFVVGGGGEEFIKNGTRLDERGGIDGVFDFELDLEGCSWGQHVESE
mmetsp:Transcript_14741/g.31781  ORF Transcript_14741/g.31781 Transcript_14741/m.31781 type:complete len:98 (-) Transcript_14741:142-435(-)